MVEPSDLSAAAHYALGMLRKDNGSSITELASHAQGVGRGELHGGLQDLARLGLARDDGHGWNLTTFGEGFEGGWMTK
jgi:DNA-binding IclR family transcriptional regulator